MSWLAAYRVVSPALTPLWSLVLSRRRANGKEDPARWRERLGYPSQPRDLSRALVWLHGASVGELQVLRTLALAFKETRPDLSVLITTGTRTSAERFQLDPVPGVIHQYVPVDSKGAVRRFLAHWRPGLAVFAESELWPNLVLETRAFGAHLALVNARISPGSGKGWLKAQQSAASLLSAFEWIGAADPASAARLEALIGLPVETVGNLKAAAAPLRDNPPLREALAMDIGGRPVWLAASTHPGEDEIVVEAHKRLMAIRTDAPLLILVPRHTERAAQIAQIVRDQRLIVTQRSSGQAIGPQTDVYIADTMGELGLFLRLCPITLVAGSLVEGIGGHNPLEPAQLGSVILTGPYVANFTDLYDRMGRTGAALTVATAPDLAAAVSALFDAPDRRDALALAARQIADEDARVIEVVMKALTPLLPAPA